MTSIVAVLNDPATARICLDVAAVAAERIPEAEVEAFHARVKPESLILVSEEVMTDKRRAELVAWLGKRSQALRETVDKWIAENAGKPAVWTEIEGERVGAIIAARGKTADLVVIVRPGEAEGKDALYAAIFETERLLLLTPPSHPASPVFFGRHMAIAWKTSEQAERAVTASIPWLKQADRVSLLLVGKDGEPPRSADNVLALLDPHGIKAEPMLLTRGEVGVGSRLVHEAHSIGADCLVMGAYRHNRLVEMILGGVTDHMLRHADLPIFMLH
jgi:nucleotide-binding universal stress UspA family protein